ncbi:MAG TPA: DUF1206 domain-containing protein [Solirubrobacteraceae bacterium]|jgi:hypothetical protein|nr:DUF1206 domain-containing protein [Solirubrobacteraceae bacterium]
MEGRSSTGQAVVREVRRSGDSAVEGDAFTWLARAGLVARGVVYGVIGLLALKVALGSGGKDTNQQGALQTIAQQPFGKLLLVAVALGLAGYAVWRLTMAAIGHGKRETSSGFDRLAAAGSGLVYGALCVTAVKILTGSSGSNSGAPKSATAGVLGWTGGTEIVAIAGIVLVCVGVYQGYKGLARKFLDEADTSRMGDGVKRAYTAAGLFGHVARAVVFALVGYGLLAAGIDYEPRKAIGLDGALNELSRSSYGPVLLGVVAAGLIGFGLFSLADARYRRI